MMQSYASAARLRGGEAHSHARLEGQGALSDHPPPRISSADPTRDRQTVVLLSDPFPFAVVGYDAGRRTMPSDSWPVVAKRQSAMSSLRANATIIVCACHRADPPFAFE